MVERYKETEELLSNQRKQELERIKRQQAEYQRMLDELNRQKESLQDEENNNIDDI